ncbi:thiamine phosphate synthase [Sphingobacterium thalpophilum]|uniref:Thiamine-phosphate synthase n=1 Tax=Sphingobacterium thalpophilum TaxID=259 RepID=A0A4U9W3S8_9SPHI|nr:MULTISPECIES: thiamine phosphate synthase [Sphingobacterium]MCW8311465.1 thiamine phosphate synthase [Sphingobacterium sp. InxBP1]VTR53361.1 Thiamine-phosphate synthase [Sphingobacterium thalpophilum]
MQRDTLPRLQYISQGLTFAQQKTNILRALDAGAKWIQIRWKQADEKQLAALAIHTMQACDQFGAKCIINDDVQLAKDLDAHGVHLGLDDCGIAVARQILGPQKIIGGTANRIEDVQQRISEQCDYIGLGPFKHTRTKHKLSPLLGIDGYKSMMEVIQHASPFVPPIFAIGGIASLTDIQNLLATGIYGVSLSGLLTETPQLISSIQNFLSCTHYK